jgi:hypothetical protein
VSCPTITLSMDYQCLLCLSPCCVLSHDYFVYDYQCLLCLSPCYVLSHDYFVYGLSMFALFVSLLCLVPRLPYLWIINVCFVCLSAVSCPTITLSMDYQCLLCLLANIDNPDKIIVGQNTARRQTKQTLIIHRQSNRGTKHSRETNKANIDNP